MKNFRAYIREHARWLAVILFVALVMTATMLLNGIPVHEIGYGMLLCAFVAVAAVCIGYARHCESFRQLDELRKNITVVQNVMKAPEYMYETYYQDCIHALVREKDRMQNALISRQQDIDRPAFVERRQIHKAGRCHDLRMPHRTAWQP